MRIAFMKTLNLSSSSSTTFPAKRLRKRMFRRLNDVMLASGSFVETVKPEDAFGEVVGYSLDSDLEAREKLEEERNLPWRACVRKLSTSERRRRREQRASVRILRNRHARARRQLKELLEKAFPDVK